MKRELKPGVKPKKQVTKEKRKRRKSPLIAAAAVLILILAYLLNGIFDVLPGLGFGLGEGLGFGLSKNNNGTPGIATENTGSPAAGSGENTATDPVDTDPAVTGPAVTVRPILTVEVNENRILYDGVEKTTQEIEAIIQEINQPDYIWELTDNRAIKAQYDQVKALFDKYGVTYTEAVL